MRTKIIEIYEYYKKQEFGTILCIQDVSTALNISREAIILNTLRLLNDGRLKQEGYVMTKKGLYYILVKLK